MHRGGKRAKLKIGKPSTIRFNIMVVGETGSGKTTFLRTLFKTYCGSDIIRSELCAKTAKTVKIEEIGCFVLDTPALDCEVHLFDSPGYGDYINNQNAIETVRKHLEKAHKAWFETNGNQMTEERRNAADKRIHCVFYFIAPHRIKDIDKEFIKQLTGLSPIVLVVAKADTMTWQERKDHLLAVKKLEKELASICKLPIAFDFQEEDSGFMDDVESDTVPDAPCPPSSGRHSAYTYNDDLDLTSSMVEEPEYVTEEPRFEPNDVQIFGNGSDATNFVSFPTPTSAAAVEPPNHPSTFNAKCSANSNEENLNTSIDACPATATPVVGAPSPADSAVPCHPVKHAPLPKIRNAFAVVCDTSDSGKREYPWGSLDIYDEEHSDFRRLQRLVFESNHITELRELTQQMSMVKYKPLCKNDECSNDAIRVVLYYTDAVTKVAAVVFKLLHLVMLATCWVVLALIVLQYVLNDDKSFAIVMDLLKSVVAKLTAVPYQQYQQESSLPEQATQPSNFPAGAEGEACEPESYPLGS